LAIAARFGAPTFFITMTCNANWPEIQSQLKPGQNYTDIPVVVARVFHRKFVEFQKRGLPHSHILVKYASDCSSPADIDAVVSAEMPENEDDARLVRRYMMHNHANPKGPVQNLNTYCQRVDTKGSVTCRFHYPHPVTPNTSIDNTGRVTYRRRRPGDEMVVPHCLPLLRELKCHVNFEAASSSQLFQYLFKYIHKGALGLCRLGRCDIYNSPHFLQVHDPDAVVDEIEDYWKARYLSAMEATWRILGFSITRKEPAVTALPVH
ncbi:hypothetical protein PHLGIDRAFT_46749, partial [Phlebiopsis gigantea 11061_1 CR5-6]